VNSNRKFRFSASFWEAAVIAVDSLRKNKLRSFLTLLGIILATTTLIAVTALIHGMDRYIAEKVSNMGSDGFRIVRMAWFGPFDPKKFYEMQKRNPQIRADEYQFLKEHARLLSDLGMIASRTGRVSYKGQSQESVNIQGITENIPAINNVQVDIGRSVTEQEVERHATVAYIGNDLRDKFFQGVDPIGKTIAIEGIPYEVIGVAKTLGSVMTRDPVCVREEALAVEALKIFNQRNIDDLIVVNARHEPVGRMPKWVRVPLLKTQPISLKRKPPAPSRPPQ